MELKVIGCPSTLTGEANCHGGYAIIRITDEDDPAFFAEVVLMPEELRQLLAEVTATEEES